MNTFHRGLLWVMVCAFSVALILESTANAGRCGNSAPQAAPQRRKGGGKLVNPLVSRRLRCNVFRTCRPYTRGAGVRPGGQQ